MKAEPLQTRDLDFDNFLANNFDDFQGFPWGPSPNYAAGRVASGSLDHAPVPSSVNEVRLRIDISLDNLCASMHWPTCTRKVHCCLLMAASWLVFKKCFLLPHVATM